MEDARTLGFLPAVLLVTTLGIGAVLVIEYLRPEKDNIPLIGLLNGLVTPTIVALFAHETHSIASRALIAAATAERQIVSDTARDKAQILQVAKGGE